VNYYGWLDKSLMGGLINRLINRLISYLWHCRDNSTADIQGLFARTRLFKIGFFNKQLRKLKSNLKLFPLIE
jgi:hypothetical protein